MKRVVLAENLRSLHNVGAIFRTADGAGWDTVMLTGYTGAPPDRRIEKVSLGAEDTVAWEHWEDPVACAEKLKSEGFEIWALEIPGDDVIGHDLPKPEKLVLILGNEVLGVSDELRALCDRCVEIPMHGTKQSLNVSVAAGIALYALNGKD